MRNKVSNLLIFLGAVIVVFSFYVVWERNNPSKLNFDLNRIQTRNDSEFGFSEPIAIVIDELEISLPVFPAKIIDGVWETTDKGVSYLSSTPIPGEYGNSILYGHNWGSILSPLHKAKIGQKISIYYTDGRVNSFKIVSTKTVRPSDTYILDNSEDTRITLYTCGGFFDQNRFVVTAFLI